MFLKKIALISFSFFSLYAFEIGNGQSLVLPLNAPDGVISINDQNITVHPDPSNPSLGIAIIPIDYYVSPQLREAKWISANGTLTFNLEVLHSPYPTETLSVDGAKVVPPPEALQRIEEEKAEAAAIYTRISDERYWKEPFILPIDSIITSEYGSARTYNGMLKSYHGGVDFRAKTPLPIIASNDGTVVLTKDRYYAGGTVIIDHGEGIYSSYFHMSRFDVAAGEKVTRGQQIGLSGASGRITGPHLHFGFMIQEVQSDPLSFIDQIDRLYHRTSGINRSISP